MSDLQKRLQMARLPPMPPRVGGGGLTGGPKRGLGKRDYSAVSWNKYFSSMQDVKVGQNTFRLYETGSDGPLCFFLHGGGFSALSWALLSEHLVNAVHCRCAAVDLRGHGDSTTDNDLDLDAETLTNDVAEVVSKVYGDTPPPIFLVGHSMGGALAARVAAKNLISSLIGLAVIDVVEGTALEALTGMQSLIRSRPASFKSLEHAIEWCVRSGHVRNLESAKVSMVGQVKRIDTDQPATVDVSQKDVIAEEEENPSVASKSEFKAPEDPHQYTWRIDLSKTEKYWKGWFEGLSNIFLSCDVPKMLLLAGVDRLDKDLTVGQMQGKFQMQVLPQAGHAVHEDVPDRVADVLATFMVRHKVTEPKDGFQRTFPAC